MYNRLVKTQWCNKRILVGIHVNSIKSKAMQKGLLHELPSGTQWSSRPLLPVFLWESLLIWTSRENRANRWGSCNRKLWKQEFSLWEYNSNKPELARACRVKRMNEPGKMNCNISAFWSKEQRFLYLIHRNEVSTLVLLSIEKGYIVLIGKQSPRFFVQLSLFMNSAAHLFKLW